MAITRQQILSLLIRADQAEMLREDGPTSLFISLREGALIKRPVQLAVCVSGDKITVRTSRLPFAKPMVFTRAELSQQAD